MVSERAWPRVMDGRFFPHDASAAASVWPSPSAASSRVLCMATDGLPRRLRLRRRRDYLRVQNTGQKHHTRNFLIFVAPTPVDAVSDLPPTRLGITVTRKVGNAVVRNQIKRLVRDVFRRNHARFASGLDVVWVAKRDAKDLDFGGARADLERLLARPGVGQKAGA